MSPREEVQQEIRDTLFFLGLNEVYGILESKENDNKGRSYRSLTFCRASTVDGIVRVYSPRFIMIKWNQYQDVFRSVSEAKLYLQRCFA
jgi:hypothetical protein